MSIFRRLTLIGLNATIDDLWDNLRLPEGYDTDTFKNALLLEHGEKCVLYPDPGFMKEAIGMWSAKWEAELAKIYDALSAEYNPIHNYDRHEEYVDSEGRNRTTTSSSGHWATDSPDFTVEQTGDSESEHKVSADNSSDYQPDYKDISNAGETTTSGKTQDLSETAVGNGTDKEIHNLTHNAHLYGNIGVTTSQDMVRAEVNLRFTRNLYDIAAGLFANELLIAIY